jgi:hypothetical protein
MSRRGFIAALATAQRKSEREAARRHRLHVAQQKELEARNLSAGGHDG